MSLRRTVAVVLALVLAACGPAAAAGYAAAADAFNRAADQAPGTSTGTLAEWRAYGVKMEAANAAFTSAVRNLSVSGRAVDDLHAVLVAGAHDQGVYAQLADASSLSEVPTILNGLSSTNAESLLRIDLGLPPVPTVSAAP